MKQSFGMIGIRKGLTTPSKKVGKYRYDKDKNFCEEFLSGEGEELYYKNDKISKIFKPMG